jgi:hypothetical protein
MVIPLVLVITLSAGAQMPTVDRSRAEDLARSGRNAEALELFPRLVEVNPADVETRFVVGMRRCGPGDTGTGGWGPMTRRSF